jgi:hypothetical protein
VSNTATIARSKQRLSTRRKLGISRASLVGATASMVLGAVGAIFSPDPGFVIGSGALLALIFLMLWQENEPPLLMFPALYQWSSVCIKPLMTVFLRQPLNSTADFPIDLKPGVTLSLFAVGALVVGMRLALGRPSRDWNAAMRNEAMMVTPGSMLLVSISAIALGHLLYFLMRYAGQASQLVYGLSDVRFMGLFALAYWCFVNGRGFVYLGVTLLVEILIGITGFFSDFRAPIFIVAFAALASGHRPKFRDMALASVLLAGLIFLGSFWSWVKMDYRMFVSGGTMQQVVAVPFNDRVDYLAAKAKVFDRQAFNDGFGKLLARQSYVDFLSATMGYVPQVLPHEHGARLGATIIHVLTPRILFPDKPATDFDTDVTVKYTGLPIQVRQTTSISIGYVGELYIDFGSVGAVIACLGLGVAFGAAYRLVRRPGHGSILLGYGARAIVISVMMSFETALIKYIGGVGIAFAGAYLLQRLLVPVLTRQMRIRRAYRTPAPAAGSYA